MFRRVFAKYVRVDYALSTADAVRKMTTLPANNLSLKDRGRLQPGAFADIVVFDPDSIQDHATYQDSHRLSTGSALSSSMASWHWTMATSRVQPRAVWSKGARGPEHREVDAANRLVIGPGPTRLFPNHTSVNSQRRKNDPLKAVTGFESRGERQ